MNTSYHKIIASYDSYQYTKSDVFPHAFKNWDKFKIISDLKPEKSKSDLHEVIKNDSEQKSSVN